MKKKWLPKYLLFVLTLFCMISSIRVHANEKKTIRVGFYEEEGYHIVDRDNKHVGYDCEYLSNIASYTGWNFEYVKGTWEECLSRLETGEIDLLGGVEKNDKRLDKFIFAYEPSIYTANCLLVENTNSKFTYEDFKTFDGMTIGTLSGSTLIDSLEEYSKENHFSYQLKNYQTENELKDALKSKNVDCIYLTDTRSLHSYKTIARFGHNSLYFALNAKRTDLISELNNAIRDIHTHNYNYENILRNKYFATSSQIAFTKQEQEFISNNKIIDVILFDNFPIICETDENQKHYGMIIDAFQSLSQKTGLTFHYIDIPSKLKWEYLLSHPNTIAAPTLNNELVHFDSEIQILDPIIQSRMLAVTKSNKTIDLSKKFNLVIAETMLGATETLTKKYPNANIMTCKSHKERLDMVSKGIADMTLINEFTGTYMLQSPYYQDLKIINSEYYSEDICVSLSHNSNPLLISIMNKAIFSFNERDIRQIVMNNTMSNHYNLSFGEWIYKSKNVVLLIVLIIIITTLFLYEYFKQKKLTQNEIQKLKIIEERHKVDLEHQKEMFYQAHFDTLTNLYNKDYFIEKANEILKNNPTVVYTFIRIHIEGFKMINEIYGQEKGNIVLQKIANRLRQTIGQEGLYGRFYSDHFAICYPIEREELEQITQSSQYYVNCDGAIIRIQLAFGIYINEQHYTDATRLLDYAQIALQNQKKEHNHHVTFFKESYLEDLIKKQQITNDMEEALRDNQFQVYLQPQYEIISHKLVGAEALIRWIHPTKGMISPMEFIPIFEGNHFIYKIDCFVFETVCKQLAKWRKSGKLIPVSVNLSRIDLQNPDLIPMIKEKIDYYQVSPKYIHLEITESVYTEKHEDIILMITKLQKLGFLIEMDDFGSGYSSLNMLKDVPVDILKLDLQFFSGETHMDKGGDIIRSVVDLAHNLGTLVIAEGVETEREANFLRAIQCRYVQGYLYNKPMPLDEFNVLLQEKTIGEKVLKLKSKQILNSYWRSEKFNNLLRDNHEYLFDYDPLNDYAIFTYLNDNDELNEKSFNLYSQSIYKNNTIHPDDRQNLQEILEGHNQIEKIEYQADYRKTGAFIWYEATLHYYFRKGRLSRMIGIIKEKAKEN